MLADVKGHIPDQLLRNKREWIIPPTKLWENKDYTGVKAIAKVVKNMFTAIPSVPVSTSL